MDVQTQIKKEVEQQIELRGSKASVARHLSISAAHLENVLQERWDLISDSKMAQMIHRLGIDGWKLVRTRNVAKIENLCMDAKDNSRFLAISGSTGLGKTATLKYMARTTPNTFYCMLDFQMTQKDYLIAIQEALGINEGHKLTDMRTAITNHLNGLEKPLLIIDDASKVHDTGYRTYQLLYDATEFQCGIVLSGTEYLREYIAKGARRNKMGFRELNRRIAYWLPLVPPSLIEAEKICESQGITDEKCVKWIHHQSPDFGTMRNLISNAKLVADKTGNPITLEMLEQLSIGGRDWHAHHVAQH